MLVDTQPVAKFAPGELLHVRIRGTFQPAAAVVAVKQGGPYDDDGGFHYLLDNGLGTWFSERVLYTEPIAPAKPELEPAEIPQTTPEEAEKTRRAVAKGLWYVIHGQDPNGRYEAAICATGDRIAIEALETAKQGYKGLAAAASAGGPVADLIDLAWNYEPPAGFLDWLKGRGEKSPAAELLEQATGKTAVMVGSFSHFDGRYPEPGHQRTCKTHWVISGQGDKANSISPVNFSLWRGYAMQGGELVPACEHCRHNRVMSFCKRIERASQQYADRNLMRWLELPEKEARAIQERLRKRNQRSDDTPINFTTFPLEGGRVVLLHDAKDIDGQPLPIDRGELYDLVAGWALATPKGKRAGHGLGKWGVVDARQEAAEKDAGEKKEEKPQGKGWRLIGKEYGRFATMLGAHLDLDIGAKGAKLDLDLTELLEFLEEFGIDYATEGQLPGGNVPFSRYNQKTTSAKQDTRPFEPDPAATQDTPENDIEAMMGAQPAPIYLNGEWV